MFKRLSICSRFWSQRNRQPSGKATNDSRIEKIELWFFNKTLSEGVVKRFEKEPNHCVLKNQKVLFDGLVIHTHIPGYVGIVDDLPVALRSYFKKAAKWRQLSHHLLIPYLFFQVGVRIGS